MKERTKILVCAIVAMSCVLLVAQNNDTDTTRHIWDTAFIGVKPKQSRSPSPGKPHYKLLTPSAPFASVDPQAVVGVTVWRLFEPKNEQAGERLLVHEAGKTVAWEPRRVSSRTILRQGDKVRITLEAARDGYLYVIDREQYASHTAGEPYLIFPTSRIRGGDNHVVPGRIIDIPAQDDAPPYLTVRRSRLDHVGEELIVIVSATPIKDFTLKEGPQRMSAEQLAEWQHHQASQVGVAELTLDTGSVWTKEEKAAGHDPAVLLSSAAPHPQTLLFNASPVAASDPLVVSFTLNYAPVAVAQKGSN